MVTYADDNHQRVISVSLSVVDEALCRFEEWARGRQTKSVMYLERNSLSPEQRESVLAAITAMRRLLEHARDSLGLEVRTQDAANDIWSRCAALRETVIELESAQLCRYGTVPRDVAKTLDATVPGLMEGLDQLIDALRK